MSQRPMISDLRKEAEAVKKCFTDFSFQALLFASAVLGVAIANAEDPLIGLSTGVVPLVMIAVARIGVHKYATANRLHGFELCMERLSRLPQSPAATMTDACPSVGWEEAMAAWRVVQASIFEALYESGGWRPNRPTDRNRCAAPHQAWWSVRRSAGSQLGPAGAVPVAYHAGSYLSAVLGLLWLAAGASLLWFATSCLRLWLDSGTSRWWAAAVSTLGVVLTYAVFISVRFVNCRRTLLEAELLSIQGCSITWELVLAANERARAESGALRHTRYLGALGRSSVVSSVIDG